MYWQDVSRMVIGTQEVQQGLKQQPVTTTHWHCVSTMHQGGSVLVCFSNTHTHTHEITMQQNHHNNNNTDSHTSTETPGPGGANSNPWFHPHPLITQHQQCSCNVPKTCMWWGHGPPLTHNSKLCWQARPMAMFIYQINMAVVLTRLLSDAWAYEWPRPVADTRVFTR